MITTWDKWTSNKKYWKFSRYALPIGTKFFFWRVPIGIQKNFSWRYPVPIRTQKIFFGLYPVPNGTKVLKFAWYPVPSGTQLLKFAWYPVPSGTKLLQFSWYPVSSGTHISWISIGTTHADPCLELWKLIHLFLKNFLFLNQDLVQVVVNLILIWNAKKSSKFQNVEKISKTTIVSAEKPVAFATNLSISDIFDSALSGKIYMERKSFTIVLFQN